MDTVKSSSDLKIIWQFADEDTRTQTIPNPKSDLSLADLQAFETSAINSQVIIGDKTGAAVTGIKSAISIDSTNVILDI